MLNTELVLHIQPTDDLILLLESFHVETFCQFPYLDKRFWNFCAKILLNVFIAAVRHDSAYTFRVGMFKPGVQTT